MIFSCSLTCISQHSPICRQFVCVRSRTHLSLWRASQVTRQEGAYLIKSYQMFAGRVPTPFHGASDRQDDPKHSNQVMMALSKLIKIKSYLDSGRGRGPPRSPGPVQADPLAARLVLTSYMCKMQILAKCLYECFIHYYGKSKHFWLSSLNFHVFDTILSEGLHNFSLENVSLHFVSLCTLTYYLLFLVAE